MKIQLLMTGNELMTGVTLDSNSNYIVRQFADIGLGIFRIQTIGDDLELLVAEIQRLSKESDILLINGGLGPTRDDLTAEALAIASGQELVVNSAALEQVSAWCERRGIILRDANRKQAYLPAGASVLCNETGSAPGIGLLLHDCQIFCTPGVPGEMKVMLEKQVLPRIAESIPLRQMDIKRLHLFGIGESSVEQLIREKIDPWPDNVGLGYRAGLPTLELKLTIHSVADRETRDRIESEISKLLGDLIVSENDTRMSEAFVQLLSDKKLRIATAESCTGGMIASMITEVAGASAVFEAGFVTYSNRIKQSLLDVDAGILDQQGAVSEAVVRAMAQGALAKSGADLVVAVSGIAGPEGGSEDKPVGTVWIAWGDKKQIQARVFSFNYGRKMFQQMVSATALDLIRRHVLKIEKEPRYFAERALQPNMTDSK